MFSYNTSFYKNRQRHSELAVCVIANRYESAGSRALAPLSAIQRVMDYWVSRRVGCELYQVVIDSLINCMANDKWKHLRSGGSDQEPEKRQDQIQNTCWWARKWCLNQQALYNLKWAFELRFHNQTILFQNKDRFASVKKAFDIGWWGVKNMCLVL